MSGAELQNGESQPRIVTESQEVQPSEQRLVIAYEFSDSVRASRWELSRWFDDKAVNLLTIDSVLAGVLYLTRDSQQGGGFSTLASTMALALLLASIGWLLAELGPYLRPPISEEELKTGGYIRRSMRSTAGIKQWQSASAYLDQLSTRKIEELMEENVSSLMTLNQTIEIQSKHFTWAKRLTIAALICLAGALALQYFGL